MSSSMFVLGVTIKAFDQMTGVVKNVERSVGGLQKKLQGLRETSERVGRAAIADGLIMGAGLKETISAFADLENASVRLKTVMMGADGTVGAFQQVNDLAVKLGNRMPGTTADFLNMMSTLKAFNITDASILGGVGEAAANLAVLLKMPPEQAAEFAAKMKEATGTADRDMLGLMDTIQRLNFMGINSTEMMYSFARSAGALKVFKIQGLEASRALAPVFAMLIKGGLSGETVGTGFASMLTQFADNKKLGKANAMLAGSGIKLDLFGKDGNLKSMRDLVAEFDKLKSLDPRQLNAVIKELTGGGQDMQMLATIVNNGIEGYDKTVADMEKQANLTKRVNAQLGTLANLWEAASGTFTNALAAFAETFAPELKTMTEWFGKLSEGVFNFTKSHPLLSKWLGLAIIGFTLGSLGIGGFALVLSGVLRYISLMMSIGPSLVSLFGMMGSVAKFSGGVLMWLGRAVLFVGRAFMLNPIGLAITAIALGAYLIYKNWDTLKKWFTSFFSWVGEKAGAMQRMLPSWMQSKTIISFADSMAGMGKPQAGMAPPVAGVNSGAQKLDAGGKLDITVTDDRVKVKNMHANDPRFGFNVDAGPMTVGAF